MLNLEVSESTYEKRDGRSVGESMSAIALVAFNALYLNTTSLESLDPIEPAIIFEINCY